MDHEAEKKNAMTRIKLARTPRPSDRITAKSY